MILCHNSDCKLKHFFDFVNYDNDKEFMNYKRIGGQQRMLYCPLLNVL